MKKGHRVRQLGNGRKRLAFECFCGIVAEVNAAGMYSHYLVSRPSGGLRESVEEYDRMMDKNRATWMDGFRG